jgi:hypothetical protein
MKIDFRKSIVYVFLIGASTAYFIFGFFHIAKFLTADEHYWIYERIPQYWNSVADGNLKKTYINDKPGVSLALISGSGYLFNQRSIDQAIELNKNSKSLDPKIDPHIETNLFSLRLPILIFNGIAVIFLFFLIKKLTQKKWLALWSSIFIGLSPILIGISQIINPDSLLWTFSVLAIVSYLLLLKENQPKYLFLAIVFTGFSLLSKYVANILFPFYLLLMFFYFFSTEGLDAKKYFPGQIKNYFWIFFGSLMIISVFLPAIFLKPMILYRLTAGFSQMEAILILTVIILLATLFDIFVLKNKIIDFLKRIFSKYSFVLKIIPLILIVVFLTLLIGRNFNSHWEIFNLISFDLKNISDSAQNLSFGQWMLLEFNPIVFSIQLSALIALLFLWIKMIFWKKISFPFFSYSLSLFLLIFFMGNFFSNTLSTIRYGTMTYPIIGILAALGLLEFISLFANRFRIKILATIIIIVISIFELFSIKPFYFNYTSILLPKNNIVTDSWGYGGYEAAQFLNSQPNAENLTIWSDFFGVCEFFKGKCLTKYSYDPSQINYYILTRRGKIRYQGNKQGEGAKKYYKLENPVWELLINNRPENYIKVFKSVN